MSRKDDTDYIPQPVDTSDVVLPEYLASLTEKLAENVHETWVLGRIKDGWTYGAARDDAAKTTPCLVPYGELPEGEQKYDRETALSVLRLIYKLGYRIVPEGSTNL